VQTELIQVAVGVLLGKCGAELQLETCYELQTVLTNGWFEIDLQDFRTAKDQSRQVNQGLEMVGWYSVGEEPTMQDHKICTQLQKYVQTPIYLLLNPEAGDPPLSPLFRAFTWTGTDAYTAQSFAAVACEVEVDKMDKVVLEQMAQASSLGLSEQEAHLEYWLRWSSALDNLTENVRALQAYLADAQRCPEQSNPDLVSRVVRLCSGLDAMQADSDAGSDAEQFELTQAALAEYLTRMTQALLVLNSTHGDVERAADLRERALGGRGPACLVPGVRRS